MPDLVCIYRLSDANKNTKLPYATKQACLLNFIKHFDPSTVHLLVDSNGLSSETYNFCKSLHDTHSFAKVALFGQKNDGKLPYLGSQYEGGSSSASWRSGWRYLNELKLEDSQLIYLTEDDYIHRSNAKTVLLEGLDRAAYCSLYDHKDKYIPASRGGNQYTEDDGGQQTRILTTNSAHWRLTNSTTLTFASSIKVLREDENIWSKWTAGSHPNDYQAFLELNLKGRSLITPIPGYSTHAEMAWASPFIDWEKEL